MRWYAEVVVEALLDGLEVKKLMFCWVEGVVGQEALVDWVEGGDVWMGLLLLMLEMEVEQAKVVPPYLLVGKY